VPTWRGAASDLSEITMSIHSLLLQRGAAVQSRNDTTVQFSAAGAERVEVSARPGAEETRLVDVANGGREVKRVRNIEYSVAEIPSITVTSDAFYVGDEAWAVNAILSHGTVFGVAECVRPERADRGGRRNPRSA